MGASVQAGAGAGTRPAVASAHAGASGPPSPRAAWVAAGTAVTALLAFGLLAALPWLSQGAEVSSCPQGSDQAQGNSCGSVTMTVDYGMWDWAFGLSGPQMAADYEMGVGWTDGRLAGGDGVGLVKAGGWTMGAAWLLAIAGAVLTGMALPGKPTARSGAVAMATAAGVALVAFGLFWVGAATVARDVGRAFDAFGQGTPATQFGLGTLGPSWGAVAAGLGVALALTSASYGWRPASRARPGTPGAQAARLRQPSLPAQAPASGHASRAAPVPQAARAPVTSFTARSPSGPPRAAAPAKGGTRAAPRPGAVAAANGARTPRPPAQGQAARLPPPPPAGPVPRPPARPPA